MSTSYAKLPVEYARQRYADLRRYALNQKRSKACRYDREFNAVNALIAKKDIQGSLKWNA